VLVQLMRRYRLRGLFLSSSPTLAVALFKVCCPQPPAPRVPYARCPGPGDRALDLLGKVLAAFLVPSPHVEREVPRDPDRPRPT
jgi:hypothetical protein